MPNPSIEESIAPLPQTDPIDGASLLNEIVHAVTRIVRLPRHAAEAIALWILHTYAWELRDVTAYLGIYSPEPRCGRSGFDGCCLVQLRRTGTFVEALTLLLSWRPCLQRTGRSGRYTGWRVSVAVLDVVQCVPFA